MQEHFLKKISRDALFAEFIGDLAVLSMLREVAATPKPGLVDRANNGAHDDMDFFTFMSSTSSLRKFFETCALIGMESRGEAPRAAFGLLQKEGLSAEKKMFAATGGVNTHKGAIFSLGLVCGAVGRAATGARISPEAVCLISAEMCAGICDEAYSGLERKKNLTKGERAFLKYGTRGVRGEAEDGYPSVINESLPAYRDMLKSGASLDDSLVQALLYIMASVHDTNVIMRHDIEASFYVRERAKKVLALGGATTPEGRDALVAMDVDFIQKNISPGGCADLLALTCFLHEIERLPQQCRPHERA